MTRGIRIIPGALFLVAFVFPLAAFALGLTGSLTGTVTQDNRLLRGVTITIASSQMQGMRQATSNEAGGYNFGGLPPGDYTVQFELQGLAMQTQRAHVGLSQT